jgi:flagellar basal-body rod modification protein FlgD
MITAAATAGAAGSDLSGATGPEGLGQDAFLQLLVTQIQMQDPLEPLKAQEFVAQLAQFTSVEELTQANLQLMLLQRAQATSQALLLIGRSIATADGAVAGLVEAVVFEDGQPKLMVGGQQVDPGDVVRVW